MAKARPALGAWRAALPLILNGQAMQNDCDRFFALTGGPGSGKTTLIEALRANGFATATEAGRGIIRDQMAVGGPALPWQDRALFAELMLSWELRSWRAAHAEPGPVFFDRGVPETMGYLRLCGLPVPDHVTGAARKFRYARRVFVAPPWPEIFIQDEERKQTFDEAERTFRSVTGVYAEFGYDLLPLPLAPVQERLRFIIDQAGLPQT
jgi:predicted ATPase